MNMTRLGKGIRLLPEGSSWDSFFPLVYLINLVFQPLFDPGRSAFDWLLVGLLIAVFLPLYFRSYWLDGRDQFRAALVMATLGFVASFFNTGAAIFYVYAAYLVGWAAPPRLAKRVLFGLCAVVILQALYVGFVLYASPYALIPFGFGLVFTVVIGVQGRVEAERERANAKLRVAHEEVERLAKIAERERIARDLHDLLGHSLSVIILKSELAAKLAGRDPQKAAAEIGDVERISREALFEVRAAVRGYRSVGLKGELANAKLALEAAGVRLEYDAERLDLRPSQESVLSLVLREAVTNVLRHAGATRCTIRLKEDGGDVRLEVCDDGRGMSGPEGSGLAGMRERVSALGGKLELDGSRGTRLLVRLPPGTGAASHVPAPKLLEVKG
jgi:two-component system sensor histidine kinase DesK